LKAKESLENKTAKGEPLAGGELNYGLLLRTALFAGRASFASVGAAFHAAGSGFLLGAATLAGRTAGEDGGGTCEGGAENDQFECFHGSRFWIASPRFIA